MGDVVTWEPTDIGVGQQAVVTFAVQVDPSVISGTQIVNHAYGAVADNAPPTLFEPPVIVTVHTAMLAMVKTATPDPVPVGEILRYTLTVSNVSDDWAVGVVVSDRMPMSTTFHSASRCGWLVGDVVTWEPIDIGVGQQAVVTFAVQVDSSLISGPQIVNHAPVSADAASRCTSCGP